MGERINQLVKTIQTTEEDIKKDKKKLEENREKLKEHNEELNRLILNKYNFVYRVDLKCPSCKTSCKKCEFITRHWYTSPDIAEYYINEIYDILSMVYDEKRPDDYTIRVVKTEECDETECNKILYTRKSPF